jgi:hypothetical protein
METKIALEDTNKYMRDRNSKAILSNDSSGLALYKAQRKKHKQMQSYGEDINSLKQEFSEIKNLLVKILENQGRET